MKTGSFAAHKKSGPRTALKAAVALALIGFAGQAIADPPVTMAPPVDSRYSQPSDGPSYDTTTAGQDSVFQWQEVPSDQRVPVRRVVFDQGGYQLFDTQGETIIVPFTDNNLYVMKFARSTDGTTYFVNGGDAPILYVPQNGYLENAAVPGARWFPFSQDFHPAEPVFLGVAPSWNDYVSMGWYPDMVCYGGYWGYHPYVTGSAFFPSFGLTFVIGGQRYHGWEPYRRYYDYHPAPYHVTILNRNIYRYDGRSYRQHDYFRGTGHPYEIHRDFSNDHRFAGSHGFDGRRDSGDHRDFGNGNGRGGNQGRVFRGTGSPTYAHRDYPGSRDMPINHDTAPGGGRDHTFGTDRNNNHRVFTGGFGHTSLGGGNGRPMPGSTGDQNFPSSGNRGGSRSGDTNRTFGGGDTRPAFGGGRDNSSAGRTNNGGDSNRTFGGGPRPTSGSVPNAPSSRPTPSGGIGHTDGGGQRSNERSMGGVQWNTRGGDHSGGSRPADRSKDAGGRH